MARPGSGTRTAACLLATAVVLSCLAGCNAPPQAQPQPGNAAPGGAAPSPTPPAVEEPITVLDVPLGGDASTPGRTPSRVGGAGNEGPTSLAVASDGTVYLLDAVRQRILAYKDGRLVRAVELPFLGETSFDLLEAGGRLYLWDGWVTEYEVALDGAILRLRQYRGASGASGPTVLGGTAESLYPRPRAAAAALRDVGKGPGPELGRDRLGNVYRRRVGTPGPEIVRFSPAGQELAAASDGGESDAVDWYLTPEGGVYALTLKWDGGGPSEAVVRRLMAGVGAPAAPDGQAPAPPAPEALGLAVPARLAVQGGSGPGLEITDPVTLNNVWQFLGLFKPAPAPAGGASGQDVTLVVQPRAGAQTRTILLRPPDGVVFDGAYYAGPAYRIQSLLDAAMYAPARLTELAGVSRAVVAITDLPGVERELGQAERTELARLLQDAHRMGRFEPPQPLEQPFPQYTVRLEGQGQTTTLAVAGSRNLYVGPAGVGAEPPGPYDCAAALGSGVGLLEVVGRWLPVPEARPGEVPYLYRATQLTISEGEQVSDLTRWKDTVVRALLGLNRPNGGGVPEPPSATLTLTFTVSGEPQVVTVDAKGFTYAGQRYGGTSLLSIGHLRGVP